MLPPPVFAGLFELEAARETLANALKPLRCATI
jgi:hypothetical protein